MSRQLRRRIPASMARRSTSSAGLVMPRRMRRVSAGVGWSVMGAARVLVEDGADLGWLNQHAALLVDGVGKQPAQLRHERVQPGLGLLGAAQGRSLAGASAPALVRGVESLPQLFGLGPQFLVLPCEAFGQGFGEHGSGCVVVVPRTADLVGAHRLASAM